jgi:hypothetical protein
MVLERLTAEEITDFILQVLLAYHMREVDRLQAIIEETGSTNRWHEFWPQFQAVSENNEHALTQFTQFIMAQLNRDKSCFLYD